MCNDHISDRNPCTTTSITQCSDLQNDLDTLACFTVQRLNGGDREWSEEQFNLKYEQRGGCPVFMFLLIDLLCGGKTEHSMLM